MSWFKTDLEQMDVKAVRLPFNPTEDIPKTNVQEAIEAGFAGQAPSAATYIVQTSHAVLTAERVATASASIEWDFLTAGQAKLHFTGILETDLVLSGFDITGSGNINTVGDLDIDGDFGLSGNAEIGGTLEVTMLATLLAGFDVTGNGLLTGDLHITGDLDVDTNLNVDGNAQIDGTLDVDGYVDATAGAHITGGALATQFAAKGVYIGTETNGNEQFNIISTGTYGYFDIGGINEDYKMRFLVAIATGNTVLDAAGTLAFTTGGAVSFNQDVSVPDDAYDASGWNGNVEVPTKNAVRDKIESILDGQAFTGAITVPDDAYASGWNGSTEVPTKNAVYDKIELVLGTTLPATYQPLDADLTAIANFSGTGFAARTASNTWAQRSLANAAAGITWTNPAGVAGDPTPVLANDLAALEGLGSTGFAVRSTTDTWVQRSIAVSGAGLSISNGNGVSANPTISLADDVATIEGLTPTNDDIIQRKAGAWANRTMAQLIADLAALGTTFQPLDSDLTSWAGVTRASGFDTFTATPSIANLMALLTDDATGLGTFLTTPSSVNLKALVTDETGSGALVFATSPTLVTPVLGVASATSITVGNTGLIVGSSTPFSDSSGTLTLQNVDALDATTEATIEAAIDTLANLTSIQGVAFTFGAYAATLLNNANEAAFKAATNLEAGTDYNAYSARLNDIAAASWVQGDIMYFNGTNLVRLPTGTIGQLLQAGGAGADPSWVTAGGAGTVTQVDVGIGITGGPITTSGTLAFDFGIVDPATASESSNQLTLDVNDGANLFFEKVLGSDVEVQEPVDMPDGTTISLLIDPTQHPTTAPAVAARSQAASAAADSTSHSITLPSGISAGDLLVCVFSVDAAPTVSVNTGVSGDNWQKLGQASNGSNSTGAIFYKIAEGSDVLTLTTTSSEQSSHICFRITGVMSTPDIGGTSSNGSSTNGDPPLHTPTNGTQNYLAIATLSTDAQVVATGAPSGYGNLTTQAAAGANGASTSVADLTLSGAASENPGTFTNTTEQWACWTILIGPYGIYDVTWDSVYPAPTPDITVETLVQIQSLGDGRYVAVAAWEAE